MFDNFFRDKWTVIEKTIKNATNSIKVKYSESGIYNGAKKLGVNPKSTLGCFLQHIESFVVNGYLRIANGNINGAGNMNSLTYAIREQYGYENILVIANDIWGGFFVINNGDLSDNKEEIWYFSPDTLEWENTEKNYTQFIDWVCSGNVEGYYQEWMWEDMEEDIKEFSEDEGVFTYPFLWSIEYELTTATRKKVPWVEITAINAQYFKQMQ